MQSRESRQTTGYTIDDTLRWHAGVHTETVWTPGAPMRYVFQHMSEFFPHSVLHRAGPIKELPPADPALNKTVASLPVRTRLGESTLDAHVHDPESQTDGIIVLQGGQVVYEVYPRMRPQDKHIIWSVTKPYVGTLVSLLHEQGRIDPDQPVETYLSELAGSEWRGIRVRDILDMTSGMDAHESNPEAHYDPSDINFRFASSLGYQDGAPETPDSTYGMIPTLRRLKEPGTIYEYSSICTFVLAWLTERVTGRALNEQIGQEIWSRIGAESDGLLGMSKRGAPWAEGGISTTLRDVARFGLLFTPSGRDPLVSDAYLRAIQREGRPEPYAAGDGQNDFRTYPDDPPLFNSWQWDSVWEDGDFYKAGWGGQGLHVSPARDLVVAYFGCPNRDGSRNELDRLARQISITLG
jgi:CubicO group peptidase (beta-lactamase class C family)